MVIMVNEKDSGIEAGRVVRSILERGLNNPMFMLIMAANATTPDDIEFTVKEILEYLKKTKPDWLKEAEGDRLTPPFAATREFVLSRREDIERDVENFGILMPVLNYFLEENEG